MLSKNHFKTLSTIALYGCVAVFSGVYFFILQWVPTFADPDSFYHSRLAAYIAEHGLPTSFPWLSQTTLAERFTDQHLLYHYSIIPWLQWFNPAYAAKAAQIFWLVILSLVLLYILRQWHLKYTWIALAGLYTVWPFVFRINLVKATPLALIVLLIGMVLLWKKRYGWLALVAAVYTMVHAGFILLFIIAIVFWIGDTFSNSVSNKRFILADPRGIFSVVVGTIIGIFVNPYFPVNLYFFWEQIVQIGFLNYKGTIDVGGEWYGYDPATLVGSTSFLLIVVLGAIVLFVMHRKKYLRDATAVSLLLLTALFLIATLRSRRFVEYFIPMTWLWAVYIILPYLESGEWRKHWQSAKKTFGPLLWIGTVYVVIAVSIGVVRSMLAIQSDLHETFPLELYQTGSEYLLQHADPGDVVFHARWGDFPMLYYHNPDSYYIVGLDATFMYLHDPQAYWRWRAVAEGDVTEDMVEYLQTNFNADWAIINKRDAKQLYLNAYLGRDPAASIAFEDDTMRVYEF